MGKLKSLFFSLTKFIRVGLQACKPMIISWLKNKAIKEAMKRVLTSSLQGGIYGWLISTAIREFFDEVGEPLLKAMFTEMGYKYDKVESRIILTKVKKARENNDQTEYDIAIDDGFN